MPIRADLADSHYTRTNAMELLSLMHQDSSPTFLVSGYKPRITGLLDSGAVGDYHILTSHIGREYFKKISNMALSNAPYTGYISDSYYAGFQPKTVTGLYSDNAG